MTDAIVGPFAVHTSGTIGQEIRDTDGKIIVWTTDSWLAGVIVRLLNENANLLMKEKH